jgi:hypothetical protein
MNAPQSPAPVAGAVEAKRLVSRLVVAACLQEREPSEANQNAYRAARDAVEAALHPQPAPAVAVEAELEPSELQEVVAHLRQEAQDFQDLVDEGGSSCPEVALGMASQRRTWADAVAALAARSALAEKVPLTEEQDPEMLAAMVEGNKWHFVDDIVPTLKAARAGEWQWFSNTRCKYIELRIDMRDLGCIIRDREKVRISPATLAFQYGAPPTVGSGSAQEGQAK